jgi:hypothetical protein
MRNRIARVAVSAAALLALFAARSAAEALTAEAIERYGGLAVVSVSYEGDFRTSRSALARVTSLREGMLLSEVDPDRVDQALAATGLYSRRSLGYELEEGGVALVVGLTEKATLVPLPIASYSGGAVTLGFMLINSDLFGSMSSLMTGGFWSTERWSVMAAYSDREMGASGIGLSSFLSAGREKREEEYADGTAFEVSEMDSADCDLGLLFRAGRALRPSAGLRLRWVGLGEDDELCVAPSLGLAWERLRSEGWFKSGTTASARCKLGFLTSEGSRFGFAGASASCAAKAFGSCALALGGSAGFGNEPDLFDEKLGGPGFRCLPYGKSFSTKYAAAYSSLEVPALSPAWGTVTLCAFAEAGVYETGPEGDESLESFYGPGAGLRVYLRNVALPALGVDLAYSLSHRRVAFSVALGFAR